MSLRDRLDVYAAREVLESGAALKILESTSQFDFSPLEEAVYTMREVAGDDDRLTEAVIDADLDFHRALVAMAESPRLTRAHETLLAETRMLLHHHPAYPPEDYVDDH